MRGEDKEVSGEEGTKGHGKEYVCMCISGGVEGERG